MISNAIDKNKDPEIKTSTPQVEDIADICFGKGAMGEIGHYQKLTVLRNQYLVNLKKISYAHGDKDEIEKAQAKLKAKFDIGVLELRAAEQK
jgi:hypothetical protein